MKQTERETVWLVEAAGGKNDFLLAKPITQDGDSPLGNRNDDAWQLYRAGERIDYDIGTPRGEIDETAWQAYRAGERVRQVQRGEIDEIAWQPYLAGERYPGFVQPFGIGERSVVITTYGTSGTVAYPHGTHNAVDIVPGYAYDDREDIDPTLCPDLDWTGGENIPVYAGITGTLWSCDPTEQLIAIRSEDLGIEYQYVHVGLRDGLICNGSYEVQAGELIGYLIPPPSPLGQRSLMHLHFATRELGGSLPRIDPTPLLINPITRDDLGQCQVR